jgi:hypothetical protein
MGDWQKLSAIRTVPLGAGNHTLQLHLNSNGAANVSLHGIGNLATCIGYVLLGRQ